MSKATARSAEELVDTARRWDRTATMAFAFAHIALGELWDEAAPSIAHWRFVEAKLDAVAAHEEFLERSIHERHVRAGLRALGSALRTIGGALEPPSTVEAIRARLGPR